MMRRTAISCKTKECRNDNRTEERCGQGPGRVAARLAKGAEHQAERLYGRPRDGNRLRRRRSEDGHRACPGAQRRGERTAHTGTVQGGEQEVSPGGFRRRLLGHEDRRRQLSGDRRAVQRGVGRADGRHRKEREGVRRDADARRCIQAAHVALLVPGPRQARA